MKLNPSTISRIKETLEARGVRNRYLQSELCDHIACDMEQMIDQGILNARYYRVKLFLWITFALFALSWLFSFRTGQFLSVIAFMALGTTLVLLSIDFFRSYRHHRSNVWLGAGILLSGLLVMVGFVLFFLVINYRVNTRGHSVDLMIFSYVILSLVALSYFIRQRKLSQGSEGRHRYAWFILFSGVQLFLAILSFLSLPFYARAVDYIWILIWMILAVDLVSLLLLIIRRIRSMMFFVLLTLSFMITFIHSPIRRLLPAGKPPQQTEVIHVPYTPGIQGESTANLQTLQP